jgi:hypothetical protein
MILLTEFLVHRVYRMKKLIVIFLTSTVSFFALGEVNLTSGVVRGDGEWVELTKVDYDAGYYPKAVVKTNQSGMIYVYDGSLGKTNLNLKKTLKGWSLKRPATFRIFPEITTQYQDLNVETDTSNYEYSDWLEGVGCMNKSPLRYGDFNGDTNNEVVLFLNDDLVLFSPNAEKIIFSMPIDSSDWLTEAESITVGKDVYGTPKHKYISKYLSQNNTLGAGHRIYGKLFMADFDDNDKLNIITWHKVYESPLLTSDQQGFIKVRDEYQLFEMADSGEYMVKAIEASAIKNLLVDANLTWQKGYPSKSECAGQEGQLIPEMHDPLLNDPDVLK